MRQWKRSCMLTVGSLLTGLASSTWAQVDCSPITDPLAKAQCATGNMQATGALSPGAVNAQQSRVPQYSGTSGCTTASCAGASQSGYFSNSGNIGQLNADGTGAYATDPKAGNVRDMQMQKDGWNVSNSSPVQSAVSTANNWTVSPQTGQTCVNNPICIEYVAAPTTPVDCTMPGVSRVVCNQNYSPLLSPSACQPIPRTSPPYHSESFINGCAPYEALLASNQAVLVSQTCTDVGDRVLACNDFTGVQFLMPVANSFQADYGRGMWYGYYQINYGEPTLNAVGGYDMQLSVSGNATGEDLYGCTNGTFGGGTWLMSPGQTVSWGGSPPYCNRRCNCWGAGLTFTLGALTWTTPTSFSIPFSYSFGGVASGTIQILGGLQRNAYTVSPITGCWQTTFEYDIQTQSPDFCQQYREAGCNQTNSICTQLDPLSGTCRTYTNTFQCAGGQVCSRWQDNVQCTSCGTPGSLVPFCMSSSTPPNTNFQQAATMMALVKEVENGFDRDTLRIFTGTPKRCDYSTIGTIIIDCCSDDPSRMLGSCSEEEISLASDKQAKQVIYVGTRCVEWVNGGVVRICTRREDTYCTFTSMLGRMVQQQGKPQLGRNFGTGEVPDCDGFTLNEFASLNFQAMNWSEFFTQIATTYDASAVAASMRTRACAMNGQTC